ncbi:hypothetical protein ACJX0J_037722, partial [Zea mays]
FSNTLFPNRALILPLNCARHALAMEIPLDSICTPFYYYYFLIRIGCGVVLLKDPVHAICYLNFHL